MDEAVFFSSARAWGEWLAAHAADTDELWVGFWKRGSGQPSLTWPESVDEALCHGWIDGIRQTVDDERYRIRFTPRRPRSRWSAKNVTRIAELQAEGRMFPAGLEVFEARVGPRDGYKLTEGPTMLPADFRAEFERVPAALAFFEAQPVGIRRGSLRWVTSAKREETRLRRLRTLIDDSANGLRIKQLRR